MTKYKTKDKTHFKKIFLVKKRELAFGDSSIRGYYHNKIVVNLL